MSPLAAGALALKEEVVGAGLPTDARGVGAHDGVLLQVVDVVEPRRLAGSGGLVGDDDVVAAVGAHAVGIIMLAVEEVVEVQTLWVPLPMLSSESASLLTVTRSESLLAGVERYFTTTLWVDGVRVSCPSLFSPVDEELVVLGLFHLHCGLGIAGVADVELQQMQGIALLGGWSHGAGIVAALSGLGQVDGRVD